MTLLILEHGLSVNFLGRTIFISIQYKNVFVCVRGRERDREREREREEEGQ